jgi:hypothetical protein
MNARVADLIVRLKSGGSTQDRLDAIEMLQELSGDSTKLQQQDLYTKDERGIAILTPAGFAALDRYHEMTDRIEQLIDENDRLRAAHEPGTDRLALLERALHQIKNGCVDDDDRANELFRLTPGELRRIAVDAIAGVGEFAPASPQPPGDDRELLFDLYLEINSTDNAPLIPYGLRESIAMQRLRNVVGEYLKATRPTKGESR